MNKTYRLTERAEADVEAIADFIADVASAVQHWTMVNGSPAGSYTTR